MRKNTSTEKTQTMKGRKSVLSNRSLFLKATILLSIVIGMMAPPHALAADKLITFSNDTGRAANDLHVWFHQEVSAKRGSNGKFGAFGDCKGNDTGSPEFDNGTVPSNGTTTIHFVNTGTMSIKKWYWTWDGRRIGKVHRGSPMAVSDVIPIDDIDVASITMTSALASSGTARSQAVPESQVVTVVVAAPRLGIARVPKHNGPIIQPADDAIAPVSPHCKVIGAAENFPGRNRRLLVRLGSKIVFRLSRDSEAVIFDRACGLVAASALLQQWTPPGPGSISDEAHYWTTIDYNRCYARACGPTVITGDCPVGVKPDRVGEYRYRVCLTTYAFPMTPTFEYNSNNLGCHGISEDCIKFKVRVVGIVPTPADLEWLAADPN